MDPIEPIDLNKAFVKKSKTAFQKRFWIFFGAAGVLVIIGMLRWWYAAPHVNAVKISDTAFTAAADKECSKVIPDLYNMQPQKGEALKNDEIASRIRKTATQMQTLTTKLDSLSVASQDATAVQDWITNWNSYTDSGMKFANAVEANDQDKWTSIDRESGKYSQKITAFAYVNKMPNCELKTQAPPSSGI